MTKEDRAKEILRPMGVLGRIYDYYNATSGFPQYGFAVQTAVGTLSTILGRRFKTRQNNWPNLYLINVGKSGTGKEHSKRIFEVILQACGLEELIAGDGYTGGGAVLSTLLRAPCHGVFIDEFGRYLEACKKSSANRNQMQREAITKLMEAFSRPDGVMRALNYSTMTLSSQAKKELSERVIYNPSITLMATTTPSTFFQSIDANSIRDGFINRFIIFLSQQERSIRTHMPMYEVPQEIIEWSEAISARSEFKHYAETEAEPEILEFTDSAVSIEQAFQQECIDIMDKLDEYHMSEIAVRTNEIAMKLSLISALSRDPQATTINDEDMRWATEYMRERLEDTIQALHINLSESPFEQDKKDYFEALAKHQEGLTKTEMHKIPPFSKHNTKKQEEVLMSLREAELINFETYNPQGRGRPTKRWYVEIPENFEGPD